MDWVYAIQSGLFIKIGVARNIAARLKAMNLFNPHPCRVVARRRSEYAYLIEKRAHKILAPHSIGREWFMIDPALARATLTIAARDVREEQIAWQVESARRIEARQQKRAKKCGREVDSTVDN